MMNKKFFQVSASIPLLILSLSGYAANSDNRVEALKKKILSMAEDYRGQDDVDGKKRHRLDALINQLLAETPDTPIAQKIKKLQGAWEQVWGPYGFDRLDGFELDANNMYQVIYPDGYYYNIGFSTFYGQKTTGFVRGKYEAFDDKLKVQFTENKFAIGFIPPKVNLIDLGTLKEAGFIKTQDVPGGISSIPAYLHEVYVDKDIRITYGGRNYNDTDNDLYVLKRIKSIK